MENLFGFIDSSRSILKLCQWVIFVPSESLCRSNTDSRCFSEKSLQTLFSLKQHFVQVLHAHTHDIVAYNDRDTSQFLNELESVNTDAANKKSADSFSFSGVR